MKSHAERVKELNCAEKVNGTASQAVEFGDDQMFCDPRLKQLQECPSSFAFPNGDAAGGVGIRKLAARNIQSLEARVVGDAFLLSEERTVLAIGGNAAVNGGDMFVCLNQWSGLHESGSVALNQLRRGGERTRRR